MLCDVLAVDHYEYQTYKDYSTATAATGYDYYGGYDQHDEYTMYGGPAVYGGELTAGRGRAGRGAPTGMHRGNRHLYLCLSVCVCLSVCSIA